MWAWNVTFAFFAVLLTRAYATDETQGLNPLGDANAYFLSSFNSSWGKAEEFCKNASFELLNVETAEENDHILMLYNMTNRVWIGGTDVEAEIGNFYWSQSRQPFEFTDWHEGEPSGTSNTTGQAERCVLYYNRRGLVKWNDAPCENEYPFICEKVVP